jgi:hypothetical protein
MSRSGGPPDSAAEKIGPLIEIGGGAVCKRAGVGGRTWPKSCPQTLPVASVFRPAGRKWSNLNNMPASQLWALLRDATDRGLEVSFRPGHIGSVRIEVVYDHEPPRAMEVLGTTPVETSDFIHWLTLLTHKQS